MRYRFTTVPALCAALAACSEAPTSPSVPHAQADLVEATTCTVLGAGRLDTGDSFQGGVQSGDEGGLGTWTHITPAADVIVLSDVAVRCRLNGSAVGTIDGFHTTWNGAPGYVASVTVEDLADSESPDRYILRVWTAASERVAGETGVQLLSATRTYAPSAWDDGTLAFAAGALVEIPASLAVTTGNAGNQWARLTFELYGTGELVRCSYRGGASVPNPTAPTDVALGSSYAFVRCDRYDAASGEWQLDPALAPGEELDAAAVALHVQGGSSRYPSATMARTTVTVALQVTPFAEHTTPGALVFEVSGPVVQGFITITLP